MSERWFRVPRVGDGSSDSPYRPKYRDRVDRTSNTEIAEEPRFVTLFEAEEDILDEIAEQEDVIELTEVEAARIIENADQPERFEGEGPKPPESGEGDTNEARLEDFVQNAERSTTAISRGEGEAIFSNIVNFRYDTAFIEEPVQREPLDELQRFPKYLFDLILRPEATTISHEFFYYWDWTAEFAKFVISEGDEYEALIKQRQSGTPDFGHSNLFHDFFTAVEFIRLARKLRGHDDRVVQFIVEMSGMETGVDEGSIMRVHGPSTLAILVGFVSRRCNMDDDGDPIDPAEGQVWRPEEHRGPSYTYHDRLQYWRHYVAGDSVSQTLTEIDDLTRYNRAYLERMAGIMGNEETLRDELGETEHFLRVFSDQRNYNMHGNGSGSIIAPLALTLCCLVLWDIVDESTYQEYQNQIHRRLRE